MGGLSSDELSSILDLLPDAILRVDGEWRITYANAAARRLPGISGERLSAEVESALRAGEVVPHGEPVEVGGQKFEVVLLEIDAETRTYRLRPAITSDPDVELRREFIEAVLDSVESGIVACDETGTLRLFNRATREFHGSSETPVPPSQWASRYNLYAADGVTPLKKEEIPLYRAFSGEVVSKAEIVIVPENGPARTVLSSGRPLIGRNGQKLGAVVAMHDITHRKNSNRRTRRALRQFRALFDDAPVPYHEIDREGIIRRTNRANCKLLGRGRSELIGHPVWEFVAERERESFRASTLRKLQGEEPLECVEVEFHTSDGGNIPVELHENLILDETGSISGIRSALLDVSARRLHEARAVELVREQTAREQAEAASQEIRSILDRIGDAYMAFDREWRYVYVNERAAELALKPANELIGRCVWDEFPEAVRTPFYAELQRALREQIRVAFENYYAPLGKWFENTVYPSPAGVAVYYRDITERKRTQQSLERQTAQLARTNAELEAFAYMASHDLQEPLRMVANYTGLLARSLGSSLDEEASDYMRFTLDGVARMQQLIQDLLTLAQTRGSDPADLRHVDANCAFEAAIANLQGAIQDADAVVERGDLPAVTMVESHLVQVLQNLIGNAMKYRGRETPRIVVTAERANGAWRFSVRDNGMGFDMRFAERIFQPFKRLHRSRSGGTGIGLAICKKIVENRGGRIWADSAVDKGSTFYFTIPDEVPAERMV